MFTEEPFDSRLIRDGSFKAGHSIEFLTSVVQRNGIVRFVFSRVFVSNHFPPYLLKISEHSSPIPREFCRIERYFN